MNRNYPHFAIPEIYGESLSYYELLRKLVNAMNVMIDNYNTIPDQIDEAVANLDASQLFSAVLNQLIHSIATDNTKSTNAVKVYKKHDLLYATFNETVNLYESMIDFSTGTATELIPGTNIREVNISELFIELRKLIDINKNNIEAVTLVANENSAEITTIHRDITAIENKNTEQDNEITTIHGDITAVENKNTEQDNEITTIHGDITAIKNKNTEQDNELSTLRTMLSSPYNFKGEVASISALPSSGEVNDTYYVQDVKYKVTWTGSAWVQSSLSEADYQTELSELKRDSVHKKDFIIENKELTEVSNTINIDLPLNRKTKKVEITNGSNYGGYYSFNIYNNGETTFLLGENVLINAGETKKFEIPNIPGTTLLAVNTNQRENSKISLYYDIDKTIDELCKYTNTVTVSQSGEGDFTKIEDAIAFLKENFDVMSTPTTIYIKNGTYVVEPTNKYPFSPLNKGANRISIIGEDMYGVVIKCTNTSTRQSKVLNIGGECTIKNLSIYCLNDGTYTLENDLGHNPYCIHNDEEYVTENKYKTVVENVYMYSECHAPLGGGLRDKQEQIYKNVVLNANGLVGAGFYVHGPSDPNVTICEINIDNVTAECNTGARAIDLSPVPNCLNFTEIPTTITRSIFITNGTDKGTTDFKVHHKLTKVSCLNNDSELNY